VRQAAQRDEWAQRVIVTYSDDVLREEQRRLDGRWRALEPFLHQVPARQELNAETALGLARARGMRWLLHLDADELVLPAAAGSLRGTGECARSFSVENAARTHFQALDDAGVGLVTYKNREGVAGRRKFFQVEEWPTTLDELIVKHLIPRGVLIPAVIFFLEEEEEGLFKADAVNEKDPERDRACMNVCMDVCMPEEGEEEEPLRRKGDKTARPRQ